MSALFGASASALLLVLTVARGSAQPAPADPGQAPAGDGASATTPRPSAAGEPVVDVLVLDSRAAPIDRGRDATVPAFVLSGDLLSEPGMTLARALSLAPAVQLTRTGGAGDVATASVRGATSAQTPIYLGGVRLNDDLTGSADLSSLPVGLLDRIELYRGHAPASADRYGIGGAVLLEPRLPGGTGGRVSLGAGSFGARAVEAGVDLGGPHAAALLSARYETERGDFPFVDDAGTRFEDSDDVVRRRPNADLTALDVWGIGRLSAGQGRLTAVVEGYRREGGAPGLGRIGAEAARARLERWLGGLSGRFPCAERSIADEDDGCELTVEVGTLVSRYGLEDPRRELSVDRRVTTAGERGSERLRLRLAPAPWAAVAFGVGQEQQLLTVVSEGADTLSARRQVLRSDADALASVGERAELALAAAVECHSTAAGRSDETCGTLAAVGRLGTRVRLVGPLALTANAARYVRVPTLGELYGVGAAVRGNAELAVEQGIALDAGLGASSAGGVLAGYAQLVGFVRLAADLIAYRRGLGVVRPYNVGEARVLGLELATGGSAWRTLYARVALSLSDPRDTTVDRALAADLLPLQSRLVAAPEIELRSPPWPLVGLDRASLGARLVYRSSRVADPAGLVVLAAQGLLDLDAAARWRAGQLTVRARVSNVLDERATDLVGYPLAGRAGYGSVEVSW